MNHCSTLQKLQKQVNRDLKSLQQWLLLNKILLNKDKQLIYFHKTRSKGKKINGEKLIHSSKIK